MGEPLFLNARGLRDPGKILKGNGARARHIVLMDAASLDNPLIVNLMEEVIARAATKNYPVVSHRLIIKSVSAKQRPRRPLEVSAELPMKPESGAKVGLAKAKTRKG